MPMVYYKQGISGQYELCVFATGWLCWFGNRWIVSQVNKGSFGFNLNMELPY